MRAARTTVLGNVQHTDAHRETPATHVEHVTPPCANVARRISALAMSVSANLSVSGRRTRCVCATPIRDGHSAPRPR